MQHTYEAKTETKAAHMLCRARAIVCVVMAVALCLGAFALPAHAAPSTNGGVDYDMANTANAAAIYVDNLFAAYVETDIDNEAGAEAGNSKQGVATAKFTPGNAGGGIGYIDADTIDPDTGKFGTFNVSMLSNANSDADRVYNYALFEQRANGGDKVDKAFDMYVRYGYCLKQLGLDQTTNGTGDFMRSASGFLLWVVWGIASNIDNVVGWCFDTLGKLNPFALFSSTGIDGGADGTGDSTGMSDYKMDEQVFSVNNMGSGISDIGKFFDWGWKIGKYIVVPLFFALFVWMLVAGKALFGTKANLTRGRNLLLRIVFVAVGIPALAWTYFGALKGVATAFDYSADGDSNISIDYVVLQNLVDFQGWVESNNGYSNLGLPADIEFDRELQSDKTTYRYTPTVHTLNGIRSLVLQINNVASGEKSGITGDLVVTSGETTTGADGSVSDGRFVYGSYLPATVKGGVSGFWHGDTKNQHTLAGNLISRYAAGEVYTPAAYQSYAKSKLGADTTKALPTWFTTTQDPANYALGFKGSALMLGTDKDGKVEWKDKDLGLFIGYVSENASGAAESVSEWDKKLQEAAQKYQAATTKDGRKKALEDYEALMKNYKEEKEKLLNGITDNVEKIQWLSNGNLAGELSGTTLKYSETSGENGRGTNHETRGLSTVAMYNYLNTDFTDSALVVYSPDAVNDYAKMAHYSVNAVGGGLFGILMLANTIMVCFTLALLGLVYGLGLIVTNVIRGIQIIVQAPLAAAGRLRSIAKVLLLTLCMIVEVLAVGVLYTFMRGIILGYNEWIKTLGDSIAGSIGVTGGTMAGAVFSLLFGTVALAVLCWLMIRARSFVIGGLTEAMSGLVERIAGSKESDTAEATASGIGKTGLGVANTAARGGLGPAGTLGMMGTAAGATAIAGRLGGGSGGADPLGSNAHEEGAGVAGSSKSGVKGLVGTMTGGARQMFGSSAYGDLMSGDETQGDENSTDASRLDTQGADAFAAADGGAAGSRRDGDRSDGNIAVGGNMSEAGFNLDANSDASAQADNMYSDTAGDDSEFHDEAEGRNGHGTDGVEGGIGQEGRGVFNTQSLAGAEFNGDEADVDANAQANGFYEGDGVDGGYNPNDMYSRVDGDADGNAVYDQNLSKASLSASAIGGEGVGTGGLGGDGMGTGEATASGGLGGEGADGGAATEDAYTLSADGADVSNFENQEMAADGATVEDYGTTSVSTGDTSVASGDAMFGGSIYGRPGGQGGQGGVGGASEGTEGMLQRTSLEIGAGGAGEGQSTLTIGETQGSVGSDGAGSRIDGFERTHGIQTSSGATGGVATLGSSGSSAGSVSDAYDSTKSVQSSQNRFNAAVRQASARSGAASSVTTTGARGGGGTTYVRDGSAITYERPAASKLSPEQVAQKIRNEGSTNA